VVHVKGLCLIGLLCTALGWYGASQARPRSFEGVIARCVDGDTLKVQNTATQALETVRLWGIDAPEKKQAWGSESWKDCQSTWAGKPVVVLIKSVDRYQRVVAVVMVDGADMALGVLSRGHAWWATAYAPHEILYALAEGQAKDRGVGLWSLPKPVPPWEWRKGR